ncbi:MAG: hypothetical protein GF309_13475 [Candidatus Lokiarchaeota archaeon]|nr:hypothetical protein [Candidatus Lokiarchaeota archaeon]
MSNDKNTEVKKQVKRSNHEKAIGAICGILLAVSIVIVDYVLIALNSQTFVLWGFDLPSDVLFSGSFIVSLAGGLLIGKAYIFDKALPVFIYGSSWIFSVIASFQLANPLGLIGSLLASSSLLIGGLALTVMRILLGKEGFDELLVLVMFSSNMMNILYFLVGVAA